MESVFSSPGLSHIKVLNPKLIHRHAHTLIQTHTQVSVLERVTISSCHYRMLKFVKNLTVSQNHPDPENRDRISHS